MLSRPQHALLYFASQILNKTLKAAYHQNNTDADVDHTNLEDWSYHQWFEYIGKNKNRWSWFNLYFEKTQDTGMRLVQTAVDHFQFCRNQNAQFILNTDKDFPVLLNEIENPPLAITALGSIELMHMKTVTVIGARRASFQAIDASYALGKKLALDGFVVVSGGAYGCDISAHQGVLESKRTPTPAIVVLAGGLDNFYPVGNNRIFSQILDQGGLMISERLWNAPSRHYDFPIRNRIVSGLSMLTIVMEAHEKSGAMLGAQLALDQGRELAVYQPEFQIIDANFSQTLIQEGAYSFSCIDEFMNVISSD